MRLMLMLIIVLLLILVSGKRVLAEKDLKNNLNSFINFVEQQQDRVWQTDQKRVMAFYYPWYRAMDFSGRWVHWKGVDKENKDIASSTHYPQLGPYDSIDEEVIAQHMKQAKEVGIDTFIVSWWGPNSTTDFAVDLILEQAEKYGISITLYYEGVQGDSEEERIQKGISDLTYIAREYSEHPAYLKVENNPVLFVYVRAMKDLSLNEWAKIIDNLKEEDITDYNIIVDDQNEFVTSVFDGIHTYNIAASIKSLSLEQIKDSTRESFQQIVNTAEKYGKISTVTIIPAYDDTKVREPGFNVPRREGKLYSTLWENAIKVNPDWILITSWNEWHEGSEIEPSIEYGEKYLEITEKYSEKFKEQPPEKEKSSAKEVLTSDSKKRLKELYKNKKVGFIGENIAPAVYQIWQLGLEVEMISNEKLVKEEIGKSDYDILVYISGEHYTQTVEETGDVDKAIKEYLKTGGTLIAAPTGPFPFYYNEKGDSVITANELGFSIYQGDIKGKENLTFEYTDEITEFVEVEEENIPFPATGDRRWRPSRNKSVFGAEYLPLMKLFSGEKDDQEYNGDGVAYIEHKNNDLAPGKTVYIWFRLLDGQQGTRLLYNVFHFLAEKE